MEKQRPGSVLKMSVFGIFAGIGCTMAFVPSLALAATPQEIASARDESFDEIGKYTKVLFGASKAGAIDDAAIAAAAKLSQLAKALPSWFPKGSGPNDPGVTKTRALAEVWTKPDDFATKVKAFQDAVAALQPAVATKDLAVAGPALKVLGDSCKGCHEAFKKPKDK